jgi:hypothetical protein
MPNLRPVRRLERGDDLSTFDSGESALDNWLRTFALSDQRASVLATYVAIALLGSTRSLLPASTLQNRQPA